MKTITLTKGQAEFFEKFKAFIKSKETEVMILKGYAGTGKTFLVQQLLEWLDTREREYRLMAPTGRAAKVLGTKAQEPAYTIHKSIYSFSLMEEERGGKKGKHLGNVKYHYRTRQNDDVGNTVYIVDEASMVNDTANDGEMYQFGSGRLLQDFIKYSKQEPEKGTCRRKILFVGDPGQLPPVGASFSCALSKDYLRETYELNCESFQLTEVVRQGKDSGILEYATQLRNHLRGEGLRPAFNFSLSDVHRAPRENIVDYYDRAQKKSGLEEVILVTFSNRLALQYNQAIRQQLFPHQHGLQIGDRLMLCTNNYAYEVELLNGDFARVIDMDPEAEEEAVRVDVFDPETKNWSKQEVVLRFRDVFLEVIDSEGEAQEIEGKIIDSLLDSPNRDITALERKALYQHFRNRYPKLKPGSKKFNEKLGEDPYFNALRLKYGYAITGHKAQGGEWQFVFVDFEGTQYMRDEKESIRWSYTAVTRAKGHLLVVR
ncbi:DEAD/DEAH box helicase [Persicobacter diffluens]|uniref:ATP-dependent endonuclease n=1 Tax=Persicobacter diffluens TaxID=981 RepID=A0AAN4VYJ2_9BACT|nr:ATP-dependent endonuclease [Persicobacter diffluens]